MLRWVSRKEESPIGFDRGEEGERFFMLRGHITLHSLSCCLAVSSEGVPPLPPGGYFGRKLLVFSNLQRIGVCKIFHLKGLRLKYCKIMGYLLPPKEKAPVSAGAFFYLF